MRSGWVEERAREASTAGHHPDLSCPLHDEEAFVPGRRGHVDGLLEASYLDELDVRWGRRPPDSSEREARPTRRGTAISARGRRTSLNRSQGSQPPRRRGSAHARLGHELARIRPRCPPGFVDHDQLLGGQPMKVLVTGGAGFIGSHVRRCAPCRRLRGAGSRFARSQVHDGRPPGYLDPAAELVGARRSRPGSGCIEPCRCRADLTWLPSWGSGNRCTRSSGTPLGRRGAAIVLEEALAVRRAHGKDGCRLVDVHLRRRSLSMRRGGIDVSADPAGRSAARPRVGASLPVCHEELRAIPDHRVDAAHPRVDLRDREAGSRGDVFVTGRGVRGSRQDRTPILQRLRPAAGAFEPLYGCRGDILVAPL